jgi:hypothetical protein
MLQLKHFRKTTPAVFSMSAEAAFSAPVNPFSRKLTRTGSGETVPVIGDVRPTFLAPPRCRSAADVVFAV